MTPERTLSHLQNLRDELSLRRFLSALGYAPEDDPYFLDNQLKSDIAAQNALADDLKIIARHGDFPIFYGRLRDQLSVSDERLVVERVIQSGYPYGLFVFCDAGEKYFRFLNVKHDANTAARRRLFRRFTVDPSQSLGRTTIERLGALDLGARTLQPLEVQTLHARAFDVESVTQGFYNAYETIFNRVKSAIAPRDGLAFDDLARHDWTQRLFNRLMFLRFLERKKWLLFDGQTDYLRGLWRAADTSGENFLQDRLYWAFFWGLGLPNDTPLQGALSQRQLEAKRGDVPFLNGGLFTALETFDDRDAVSLNNEIARQILDFFDAFNFTITESTPFDVEVAVDPEMLGKVFEELVTNRHGEGAYYTPRAIVSFMGREALQGYLRSSGESEGALARFVEDGDATLLRNPERVLERLKTVTICDPACGSGAYLLGAMGELLRLRQALFVSTNLDALTLYERKLEIISRNLYGVDKSEFAVNIAMLRLWLSLIIDFDGPREAIPALPNLGFKIGCGDSLAAPDPLAFSDLFGAPYLEHAAKLGALHEEHLRHGIELKAQRAVRSYAEIEAEMKLESEAVQTLFGDVIPAGVFDWRLGFAEVLARGGFDIAVANPPYVRQELLGAEYKREVLAPAHPDVAVGAADLFVYFYSRALQLLKDGGMLAFISSNKWLRAGYGAKLRAHLANTTQVQSLTDFGDLPVFQSAIAYPMICIAQKGGANEKIRFTAVKSLGEPYPDVRQLVAQNGALLPETALNGSDWQLSDAKSSARLQTMRKSGVSLGEYVKGQIFRGVLTGLNAAFVLDGATRAQLIAADAPSAELIKPLVAGRDIKKWAVDYRDKWLIFTRRGTDIEKYPAIKAHLQQWQAELTPKTEGATIGRKPGRYKWFEIQDEVAYFREFDKPKILYQEIATFQAFAYDTTGAFTNNKAFLLPSDDFYLLGVLNSAPAWEFLDSVCPKMVGGAFAMQTPAVFQLPIPSASASDKSAIETLVSSCLAKRGLGCEAEEGDINARVSRLYGL